MGARAGKGAWNTSRLIAVVPVAKDPKERILDGPSVADNFAV